MYYEPTDVSMVRCSSVGLQTTNLVWQCSVERSLLKWNASTTVARGREGCSLGNHRSHVSSTGGEEGLRYRDRTSENRSTFSTDSGKLPFLAPSGQPTYDMNDNLAAPHIYGRSDDCIPSILLLLRNGRPPELCLPFSVVSVPTGTDQSTCRWPSASTCRFRHGRE